MRVINRNIELQRTRLNQDCLLISGPKLPEWVIRQATLSSQPPAGPGGNGGWAAQGVTLGVHQDCTKSGLCSPTLRLISGLGGAPPSLSRHSRLGTVGVGNSCRIPLTSWDTSRNPWSGHPGHLEHTLSPSLRLKLDVIFWGVLMLKWSS